MLKDEKSCSALEITMESSFQRDLFSLVFSRMNQRYVEELGKIDLKEIDFYRRRETFLNSQLSHLQLKLKEEQ